MPVSQSSAIQHAREDKRAGKAASTQAGEFVREEIEHIRAGEHGVRSTKQAIAIGLSKARRAGVKLPPPAEGKATKEVRRKAALDLEKGRNKHKSNVSGARSKTTIRVLRREGQSAVSTAALARQGRESARKRGADERSSATRKAAKT